jgi:hypothetical protein
MFTAYPAARGPLCMLPLGTPSCKLFPLNSRCSTENRLIAWAKSVSKEGNGKASPEAVGQRVDSAQGNGAPVKPLRVG